MFILGSRDLSEDEFVSEVESCRLPKASWRHGDHVRLAWCYLRRFDPPDAEEGVARCIRAYSASLGVADKYHDTMTRAWTRLVSVARLISPNAASFDDLIHDHPWLLDKEHLRSFYSAERLESGRAGWVSPDLKAFPCGYWCC